MNFIEVKTTFEDINEARNMVEHLLDEKLISCGQISKIESHYVWKNERFNESEFLLTMKTKASLFNKVKDEILKTHSYEVAEIVATKIENISLPYAEWISKNTL